MLENFVMSTDSFLWIFIAALLWAFIWIEREIPRTSFLKISKNDNFWWLRTYSILAIIWAISVWFDLAFHAHFFSIIWFLSIIAFILINHSFSVYKKWDVWLTSEFSAILTYFIWVLVMLGNIKFALIITIFLTVLLSSKEYLEKIVKNIDRQELLNTLKFAVVSFVILPLLPDSKYSFWMIFEKLWFENSMQFENIIWQMEFFNPYSVWFFVVAISAIGYIWYILSKAVWKKSSIILSSILGWLVSSTAVTATMSEQSKKDKSSSDIYVVWTLSANLIMIIRVFVIVAFFNFSLLKYFSIPFVFMFLWLFAWFLYFYYIWKKKHEEPKWVEQKVESPFSILPALKFGWFVLFIKFLAWVGILYESTFPEWFYYYTLWIISWFADVDAITQTMAVDSSNWWIMATIAVSTIIFAIMSNNIVKWFIALKFGEKSFWRKIMFTFLLSIVTWIIGIIISNMYIS